MGEIRVGSLVSVTGICRTDAKVAVGTPGAHPLLFHVDMRSPEDLKVLAPPSWWTVRHLMLLLAGLLVIALAVAGWALALRLRVARQKREIERVVRLERERAKLLEAISSAMPLEELLEAICGLVGAFAPGLSCWCTLTGPILANDETHECASTVGQPAPVELLSLPLGDKDGEPAGSFRVGAEQPRTPTPEESEVIAAAGGLAALALNQRRMYEELQYRSLHDGLTALANRRCADQQMEAALEDVRAHGGSLLVAYIDIDGFKEVNDQHGHKLGDLYLQEIAARLRKQKRRGDLLARMGGDEFLMIARGRAPVEPELYRQRLEGAFAEPFLLDGVWIEGAASVGVAVYPLHGDSVAELQRYADAEMYAIKRGRRGSDPCAEAADGLVAEGNGRGRSR